MREPVYVDEVVEESARALRVTARDRGIGISVGGDTEVHVRRRPSAAAPDGDKPARQRRTACPARWSGLGDRVISKGARRPSASRTTVRVSPEHERERIFERFVRLSSDYAGAGLGLPIAQWIAEAHGGELVLESGGPGGTVFAVMFPRAT